MSDAQPVVGNRRLGRGLSALLGNNAPASVEVTTEAQQSGELSYLPIGRVVRNPFQPRKQFDQESIGELASSIKEHGVIQPIVVRELDGSYQIIAGERRWLAAQKSGLTTIPARIIDVIDKTACELALEENLKRKDLNDLEKAQAFKDYLDQFQCSIEELGKQLSMNRSTISNMLRLLELSDPVKNAIHSERITAGHARALLPLQEADQIALCGRIQAEKLSVRGTEQAVKEILGRVQQAEKLVLVDESAAQRLADETFTEVNIDTIPMIESDTERTNHITSLEEQLRDLLGVKVNIKLTGKDSGTIHIPFATTQEFERIMKSLRRSAA